MGNIVERLKRRREQYEESGAATKIDRSKPEGAARALGWLKGKKNKNVQKEFNKGAGGR